MLNKDQIAIIKQTVPVLQEHGVTLTRHFYERMFRQNPEVLGYFNPAHQHAGTQQQALAAAVCAYAANIEDPSVLAEAVERIAHKHVSLQIQPEHYPIVGENLLGAIREVLGEAATEAVIDAWAAAYSVLSGIMVTREAEIYAEQEREYGWKGFRRFVVARREAASEIVVSFYLRPEDGQRASVGRPGQYVTVRVTPSGGGQPVMRNYSLSGDPAGGYRISVKKEQGDPNGVCSTYLHDHVQEGAVLELAPPCGEFVLRPSSDERPLVLIAGGVGITPLMAMLHASLKEQPGREVLLIQCARTHAVRPFASEISALDASHANLRCHIRLSEADDGDSAGVPDDQLLAELVGDRDAEYYFCGPSAMMKLVHRLLTERGVPDSDIRFEFFGPMEAMAA